MLVWSRKPEMGLNLTPDSDSPIDYGVNRMSESAAKMSTAQFSVGDVVHHKLFDYRGVVIDVDPQFELTEEWYETVARTRPPKDRPWYHVLLHKGTHHTYVAERNLEPDRSGEAIQHPLLGQYFTRFSDGRYVTDVQVN